VKDGSGNPFAEFTQQKIATNSLTATQRSGVGGTPKYQLKNSTSLT